MTKINFRIDRTKFNDFFFARPTENTYKDYKIYIYRCLEWGFIEVVIIGIEK